jgi:hypothetical protein
MPIEGLKDIILNYVTKEWGEEIGDTSTFEND